MTALEGTTDVPVVGKVKKQYVIAAGALVAGIVGYAWWKRRAGATAPADAVDGGLYADTRTGSELPTDTYTNPAPNADGQSGTGIGGDSVWHAPSTDQEWAQQALERLSWYEPGYTSAVVGKYLARQPTTPEEQTLIREAWAQIGHPPGNQPLITSSTPAAATMVAPTGLHVYGIGRDWVQVDWNDVNGAKAYDVAAIGPKLGGHKATVATSSATVPILAAGTTYTIAVKAISKADGSMGPAANVTVTTKK